MGASKVSVASYNNVNATAKMVNGTKVIRLKCVRAKNNEVPHSAILGYPSCLTHG